VARTFAQRLMEQMRASAAGEVPVFMGGVLNEDIRGSEIPIDVTADLNATGIRTPGTIDRLIGGLVELKTEDSGR
jgi:hypothetical protein